MPLRPEDVNARIAGRLAGELGVQILELSAERVTSRLELRETLMNTIGSLHAAAIVAIADTTCGAGTLAGLSEGASGFVTLELKTSFVGKAQSGAIRCVAKRRHSGRTTELWEAAIEDEATGKPVAFFSCTQLLLCAAE